MRHELDWWMTKCSCKWGGCKICWATNKQVSLHNDLLKFWLSKEKLKENLAIINGYLGKIDSYSLYEYISWEMDEEKFNGAVTNYKSWIRQRTPKKKVDLKDFKPTPNPKKSCVFNWPWVWERCIHCNSIRKYMVGKDCPKYIWED